MKATVHFWVASCSIVAAGSSSAYADAVDDMLRLIPADASAALIVPNLKAASDELTRLLEGMDRANLLLGSRPLDQLKSTLGFNSEINDVGGLALYFMMKDIEPGAIFGEPAVIVPALDAERFLNSNFVSHNDGGHQTAAGITLFAKPLASHVLLSRDKPVVDAYETDAGIGAPLATSLGEAGRTLLRTGEAFIVLRHTFLQSALHMIKSRAAKMDRTLPGIVLMGFELMEGAEIAVIALDFDPLAALVRSASKIAPESAAGKFTLGGVNGKSGLGRVPNKPFYGALALDLAGLGGAQFFHGLADATESPQEMPAWVGQSSAVQFAVYPGPAGLAGGLLNDAVLVFQTSRPADARAAVKQEMEASVQTPDGVRRNVKWTDSAKALDGGLTADTYEMKVIEAPPEQAQYQMVQRMLVGQAGWRGFVVQLPDALLMTFSQRPAVLEAAVNAARNGPNEQSNALSRNAAITTMRTWMPAHLDLEGYLDVAQIARLLGQIANSLGMDEGLIVPEFDANTPPIGFGAEIEQHTIETASIIPAGVLAIMLDQLMSQMAAGEMNKGAGEPETKPEAGITRP